MISGNRTNDGNHPGILRIRHNTDNGSEFSNPKGIEYGPDGKGFQRTRIYYCNPSAPYQKAEIEVGHEFIRRVLPKGKSFDELMQEDINRMMVSAKC
jgi:IS30 family transposase